FPHCTTALEISPLSLHDALPIYRNHPRSDPAGSGGADRGQSRTPAVWLSLRAGAILCAAGNRPADSPRSVSPAAEGDFGAGHLAPARRASPVGPGRRTQIPGLRAVVLRTEA